MPDQRGMGLSDKPHEFEAYGFDIKVADVLSVLDAEGIDKASYWASS